jgi:hypothetical protein
VLARAAEAAGELGAGADAELGVHPAQVAVDGGHGQVQLLGDLLVGRAGGHQLGDPPLAGRQPAARCGAAAADPGEP